MRGFSWLCKDRHLQESRKLLLLPYRAAVARLICVASTSYMPYAHWFRERPGYNLVHFVITHLSPHLIRLQGRYTKPVSDRLQHILALKPPRILLSQMTISGNVHSTIIVPSLWSSLPPQCSKFFNPPTQNRIQPKARSLSSVGLRSFKGYKSKLQLFRWQACSPLEAQCFSTTTGYTKKKSRWILNTSSSSHHLLGHPVPPRPSSHPRNSTPWISNSTPSLVSLSYPRP